MTTPIDAARAGAGNAYALATGDRSATLELKSLRLLTAIYLRLTAMDLAADATQGVATPSPAVVPSVENAAPKPAPRKRAARQPLPPLKEAQE